MTLCYTVAVRVSRSVIIEMLVTITNMTAVEYWNQTATFGYKFTFISSSAAALVSSPEPTVGTVGW